MEQAIRRIKEFHIFDISLSTLGSVKQMFTVASLLTNFQGPLIMKAAGNGNKNAYWCLLGYPRKACGKVMLYTDHT